MNKKDSREQYFRELMLQYIKDFHAINQANLLTKLDFNYIIMRIMINGGL